MHTHDEIKKGLECCCDLMGEIKRSDFGFEWPVEER